MQVGAPPRHFTGRVNFDHLRSPYNADQSTFRQHFAAADAGPLGHVFSSFRSLRHIVFYSRFFLPGKLPIFHRSQGFESYRAG